MGDKTEKLPMDTAGRKWEESQKNINEMIRMRIDVAFGSYSFVNRAGLAKHRK